MNCIKKFNNEYIRDDDCIRLYLKIKILYENLNKNCK